MPTMREIVRARQARTANEVSRFGLAGATYFEGLIDGAFLAGQTDMAKAINSANVDASNTPVNEAALKVDSSS